MSRLARSATRFYSKRQRTATVHVVETALQRTSIGTGEKPELLSENIPVGFDAVEDGPRPRSAAVSSAEAAEQARQVVASAFARGLTPAQEVALRVVRADLLGIGEPRPAPVSTTAAATAIATRPG